MIDVEPLIVRGLDALVPELAHTGDWSDVKQRAGLRANRLSWKIAAIVVAVGAIAVGAVAATGFGTFGRWITGEPGSPAPTAAQRAFTREIRSWRGFPATTKLRQVLTLNTGGSRFVVDAYRGARTLCLRVTSTGKATGSTSACVPLALLQATKQPAWVLAADEQIGTGRTRRNGPMPYEVTPATITFGIAADGVTRLTVKRSNQSATDAVLASGAFLSVTTKTPADAEVTKVVAYAGANSEPIRFQPSATIYGLPSGRMPPATVGGPATVQRGVHGGAIHWFARRQPHGVPVPKTIKRIVGVLPDVIFARLVTPDPDQPERIVLSIRPAGSRYFGGRLKNNRSFCAELVGPRLFSSGGGCWPAGRVFSYAPFSWAITKLSGGQTAVIAGAASDDVATLRLFTAAGRATKVPLHDNAYFALAGTGEYPLRLVAYDNHGKVIGTHLFKQERSFGPMPLPGAHSTLLVSNTAGQVWTTPGTDGTICYAFDTKGAAMLSCNPKVIPATALMLSIGSSPGASTIYISGRVGTKVATVQVNYRTAPPVTLQVTHGVVLAAVHRRDPTISGGITDLVAIARSGKQLNIEHVGTH